MTDIVDKKTRSKMMSGIRGKDTKPETVIRKALYAQGYRFRLHVRKLPGRPDIVLPQFHSVIFINGCFWHHHNCHLFKWPSTRPEFWKKKINRNVELDKINIKLLSKQGWYVLTIWECALKGKGKLPLETVINRTVKWLEYGVRNYTIKGRNFRK